jgi:tRNA uridine 5-carbamoylmethylation protein Kti12
MKSKFLKYWKSIPILYSFAFVLDPRAKIRCFSNALQVLSRFVTTDYSEYFNVIRSELTNMFSKYEIKFGAAKLQRPTHTTSTSRKKTSWAKFMHRLR